MEPADVRRRVRQAVVDARARAARRRENAAAAEEDGRRALRRMARLFRTAASVLTAEGHRFGVETPVGAIRLSPGGASGDFIELALDTTRDPPALMGRTAYARGRHRLSEERVVAEHPALGELAEEEVLDFVLSALAPMLER